MKQVLRPQAMEGRKVYSGSVLDVVRDHSEGSQVSISSSASPLYLFEVDCEAVTLRV